MRFCLVVVMALLALGVSLSRPTATYACSIEEMLLDQLVERGEWIVEGTVSEVFGDGYGAEVQVSLVYRGEVADRVTVNPSVDPPRTFLDPVHGWVTEEDSCIHSQASFVEGEQVLLFLREDPVRGWTTLGMSQGKVSGYDGAVVGQGQEWPQEWAELQAIVSEGVGQEPSVPPPANREVSPPSAGQTAQPRSIPLGALLIGSAVVLAAVALVWGRIR